MAESERGELKGRSINTPEATAKGIFAEALKLAGAERGAYLDRTGAGNLVLRQEVESLRRAHENAGEFVRQTIMLSPSDYLIEPTGR